MKVPAFVALVLALLVAPAAADAQVCRRGKPCGNTCIARNKTCRVGAGTARAGSGSPPAVRAPASAAGSTGIAEVGGAFVASSRGSVFYWTGGSCSSWRTLSAANLRWFGTAEEALAAGYRSSASSACVAPEGWQKSTQTDPAIAPPSAGPIEPDAPCTVSTVVDGDTLDCADGRRIRLLLIDSPEMDQGPFGEVARVMLSGISPPGTTLQVKTDIQLQDRYGRLLAYLRTAEGVLVNEELLRRGVALVSVYPPNVEHIERFRAASDDAREQGRGLWAVGGFACEPADHRAGKCERERFFR